MSLKLIFLTISFVVLTGCMPNATDVQPSKMVSDYFHMTTSEQIQQFKDHNLDEQYKIFLFGNQVVHPPAIYLARPFAEQGPSIVPFLKTKLETTQEEVTIRDLVTVFSELAKLKLYDFSNAPELMELLKRKANNMQGIWKETTIKMIAEMWPYEQSGTDRKRRLKPVKDRE